MRLPPGGFAKYHALGNDYLVMLDPWAGGPGAVGRGAMSAPPPLAPAGKPCRTAPSAPWVAAACDRHRGVGADGLLWLTPAPAASGCDAGVVIFNADGSQAERSGNGLRIAARALWDFAGLPPPRLRLWTATGPVEVRLSKEAVGSQPPELAVEMGAARHGPAAVGMRGHQEATPPLGRPAAAGEAAVGPGLRRDTAALTRISLEDAGRQVSLALALVGVGNPHAVWWRESLDEDLFLRLGAAISGAAAFPRRINVQMAAPEGRRRVRVRIFERGVGPTQASGSSACAVAATAWRQGICDAPLTVQMPGGELVVDTTPTGDMVLYGPVALICTGTWPTGHRHDGQKM